MRAVSTFFFSVGIRSGSSFCCRRPALLSAPHQNPTIPWSLLPNRSPAAALIPTTVLGQPIAVGITSWLLVCWFVWLPGSNATATMMTRSAEDRGAGAAGRFLAAAAAAARAEKQRAVSPHKVGPGSVMGLGVPDPKPQQQYNHNQGGSGSGSGHQHQQAGAAVAASTKPAPKL